jgi:hypothetical protein
MVLAIASGAALSYGDGDWLGQQIQRFVQTLKQQGVPMPPTELLRILSITAFLSWYQPVILRIGAIHSALWVAAYALLTLGTIVCHETLRFPMRLMDVFLLGNLGGLVGLLAIRARTRAWMSLVGGALSIVMLYFVTRGAHVRVSNVVWLATVSQAVYGAVMIWGTRRLKAE